MKKLSRLRLNVSEISKKYQTLNDEQLRKTLGGTTNEELFNWEGGPVFSNFDETVDGIGGGIMPMSSQGGYNYGGSTDIDGYYDSYDYSGSYGGYYGSDGIFYSDGGGGGGGTYYPSYGDWKEDNSSGGGDVLIDNLIGSSISGIIGRLVGAAAGTAAAALVLAYNVISADEKKNIDDQFAKLVSSGIYDFSSKGKGFYASVEPMSGYLLIKDTSGSLIARLRGDKKSYLLGSRYK